MSADEQRLAIAVSLLQHDLAGWRAQHTRRATGIGVVAAAALGAVGGLLALALTAGLLTQAEALLGTGLVGLGVVVVLGGLLVLVPRLPRRPDDSLVLVAAASPQEVAEHYYAVAADPLAHLAAEATVAASAVLSRRRRMAVTAYVVLTALPLTVLGLLVPLLGW
ncbi:hypothetical protein JOF53_001141 [Crossiella equi]|uniref:Phage holin family protein n=1 Tax=Crossiella equi TaxID=130796 RepID=A0ABS5A7R5_9PSEU|nr:hypothetical protein [Crossiella equi]MBP2472269.1 hypothetical protein [Crossiella equi]